MAGKREEEGPWLFDGRGVLEKIASRSTGAKMIGHLAEKKRKLDCEREQAYSNLVESTLPLADFIQAACGPAAYQVANAVLDTLGARSDPDDYGKKVGKRPAPRSPGEPERSTRLYAELRADARRLRPLFRKIWQEEEACKRALAALVPHGDRKKYRRWYAVTEGLDPDIWLHALYSDLDNWTAEKPKK